MDMSSLCPIDSGVSAVKLRPELLMSIVRPDPFSTGPRWPTTLYRTSRFNGKRTLARRSGLESLQQPYPPYDPTIHHSKFGGRPAFGTVRLVMVNVLSARRTILGSPPPSRGPPAPEARRRARSPAALHPLHDHARGLQDRLSPAQKCRVQCW